jgi:hydrocephalus-inducing protein
MIENRGEIDFRFFLQKPDSLFGPKFKFIPEAGLLKKGEQQVIKIMFNSDILGTFSEEFLWELEVCENNLFLQHGIYFFSKGSPDKLSLCCKGQVVGPTFHFDSHALNFGKLSHGFLSERTAKIVNTSLIPMTYVLHIPSENSDQKIEFLITPQSGTIPPLGSALIKVEFTPRFIKTYEDFLYVDVEAVGEDLLRLPIFAESIVPEVCACRQIFRIPLSLINPRFRFRCAPQY